MQSFRLHDKASLVEIRMGTFQLGSPLIVMRMRIPKKSGIPQMTWLHLVPFLLVVPCKRHWFLEPKDPCTGLVSKQFPSISLLMPIHAIHLGFEKVMMLFGKSTKGPPKNCVEGSRLELMNGTCKLSISFWPPWSVVGLCQEKTSQCPGPSFLLAVDVGFIFCRSTNLLCAVFWDDVWMCFFCHSCIKKGFSVSLTFHCTSSPSAHISIASTRFQFHAPQTNLRDVNDVSARYCGYNTDDECESIFGDVNSSVVFESGCWFSLWLFPLEERETGRKVHVVSLHLELCRCTMLSRHGTPYYNFNYGELPKTILYPHRRVIARCTFGLMKRHSKLPKR